MSVPTYDGKESITKYLRRVEDFRLGLQKEKYTLLLNFINDLLKLSKEYKFKSLTDFSNISEVKLLADPKHNRDVLRTYSDKIINVLNVKFDVDDETGSEEIKDTYIVYFLSKALSSIDYSLSRMNKSIGGKEVSHYTIKLK